MPFLNPFSKKKIKTEEKLVIIVDHREKNSLVISELENLGISLIFKQLPVADYLIKNVAIERKTIADFKSSIANKRIMKQLLELKQYPKPLLILEGLETEDPYSSGSGLHENAFRGFLLSILTEYEIPIIFTLNEKDTAKYLSVLVKKQPKKDMPIRATKIFLTKKEQLQFIIEGLPTIGPVAAKKLLKHFKTITSIVNASQEDLKKVIGKKAEIVYKIFNSKY